MLQQSPENSGPKVARRVVEFVKCRGISCPQGGHTPQFEKRCIKSIKNGFVAHPVQWLVTPTAVPLGMGSNPGEDMDVCKCILPSRHGGTLNNRRAASPLVRLVEWEEKWEAPDHPRVFSLKIGAKPC
ncbi:uncharacterized protein TNCV_4019531 [Trichonephila clavipes]|nr:uncharacterized protein TNCV_4019531 [Trichonephila clavipes]